MPGFDGAGPRGKGPLTGGGRGYCAVLISTPEQELSILLNQAGALRLQAEELRKRINNMMENTKEVRDARI